MGILHKLLEIATYLLSWLFKDADPVTDQNAPHNQFKNKTNNHTANNNVPRPIHQTLKHCSGENVVQVNGNAHIGPKNWHGFKLAETSPGRSSKQNKIQKTTSIVGKYQCLLKHRIKYFN